VTSYSIRLPPGTKLLTSNQRYHWRTRAKVTKDIRVLSREIARREGIPALGKIRVRGIFYYHDNRRRDPGNWYPSLKAMIDGAAVDAGVIIDDDDKHLIFDGIHRGYPNVRHGQLVLEIEADDD
jgi:hypothetical protein